MSVSDQSVNRQPSQLLRFLGISGADAPNRVADVVQGTVDLLPWWAYGSEQGVQATITYATLVTGFLSLATLNVPDDARWLVTMLSCRTAPGAGNTIAAGVGLNDVDANHFYAFGPQTVAVVNPGLGAIGVLDGRPNYLLIGQRWKIGGWVSQHTGASSSSVIITARFIQFSA